MPEAILKDKKRILPFIAFLEGEYGYKNLYIGVPTVLGGNGIEKYLNYNYLMKKKQL